jgi:hypothetical protein
MGECLRLHGSSINVRYVNNVSLNIINDVIDISAE